jgi:hypothetical protein
MHWYLAFANETDFLGACVIKALTQEAALMQAESLGICPMSRDDMDLLVGLDLPIGKAKCVAIPMPEACRVLDPVSYDWLIANQDRLLSKEEIQSIGGVRLSALDAKAQAGVIHMSAGNVLNALSKTN